MARREWELERPLGRCVETGRTIEQGEEFYTVLFEEGETFRRADFCLDAWKGPPPSAFCYFKSRVPRKESGKKLRVNTDLLKSFFIRLADETEPLRLRFRFVIALMLMQKRLLRYERSSMIAGKEIWEMTLVREQSIHRVVNPHLIEEQVEEIGRQLSAILQDDVGDLATAEHDGDGRGPTEG